MDGVIAEEAAAVTGLAPGERIGQYEILRELGHGGMGSIYLAVRADDHFRKQVAIKLTRVGYFDRSLVERFRTERQILANLEHPGIARLLDGGATTLGSPYVAMEYVDGLTLDRYVAAHGPSVPERLALFRQICAAIQHAHQNLVVHRDLKPGNIMVTAGGLPKLLDFGIAKLLSAEAVGPNTALYTRPADRLMTPEYASPEQIRGETITTATDIYGLGVLLYELRTGSRRPPSLVGLQTVKVATRKQTDLDRIVLKALHKTPGRRYASAARRGPGRRRLSIRGWPASRGRSPSSARATII